MKNKDSRGGSLEEVVDHDVLIAKKKVIGHRIAPNQETSAMVAENLVVEDLASENPFSYHEKLLLLNLLL